MSLQKLLKGAEGLLAFEKSLRSAPCGSAPLAGREAAIKELEGSVAEFRDDCLDGGFCRRVMIAVDESQPAHWAMKVGINLAEFSGARLALIHVIHGEMSLTPEFAMARPDLADYVRHTGEDVLRDAKSLVPPDLQVEAFLRVGDPSQQIVTTAEKWRADLIVLGTHGRAGIAHMLIGSTAGSVVRRADCPVLTVGRDPAEKELRPAAERTDSVMPFARSREPSEQRESQVVM